MPYVTHHKSQGSNAQHSSMICPTSILCVQKHFPDLATETTELY